VAKHGAFDANVELINVQEEQQMVDLPKGYAIQTKTFKKVVVGEKLGEGGQGRKKAAKVEVDVTQVIPFEAAVSAEEE
jgi:hypothetical protein